MVDATHTSGSVNRGKSSVCLYFIHLPLTLELLALSFTKIYTVSLVGRYLRVASKLRSSDVSSHIFIIRQRVAYNVTLFKYIIM